MYFFVPLTIGEMTRARILVEEFSVGKQGHELGMEVILINVYVPSKMETVMYNQP